MGACSVAKLCPTLCNPMDLAHEAPLSMEFSRQEYWSGLPFPTPRGSSWPRVWTHVSCVAGRFFTYEPPGKPQRLWYLWKKKKNVWNMVPAFKGPIGWNREKLHKSLINTFIVIWKIFCNHIQTSPKGDKIVFPEETPFEMKGGEW